MIRAEATFASRLRCNRAVVGAPLIDGKFVFKRTSVGTPHERAGLGYSPDDWIVDQDGIGAMPGADDPVRGSNIIQMMGHAEIALNPTRAFIHQPLRTGRRVTLNPGASDISMHTRELPEFGNTRPINPTDDNVFYHNDHYSALRRQSFSEFSDHYVRQSLQQLDTILRRAQREVAYVGHHVDVSISTYFNIKQVETYWTLDSAEPIHDLMQVEPRFRALGAESNRRIYSNVTSDLETELNVPCLSTRVERGLTAKLYPKTNDSVRFEFTRDFRHRSTNGPAHTFDGAGAIERLLELLSTCREQAAIHARSLGELLVQDEHNETYHPAYRLVEEIVLAAPNRRIRQLLLELLINNRSYTSVPYDEMRNPIRRLVRRGVVERVVRNGRTVRLTPPYNQAASILANHQPVTDIARDADFEA
ncbi:MAG: hypothetical protein ABJK39_13080 [Hyphomicrobiales bacterium]